MHLVDFPEHSKQSNNITMSCNVSSNNNEMVSPEFYLKQWYSMGGQATDSFMNMMTAGARAATGEKG